MDGKDIRMTDQSPAPPAKAAPKFTAVALQEPIIRGETEITSITLREPRAGELRGLSLQALGQSDVSSLITLLPRISDPALIDAEVANLNVADLAALGSVVFDFFLTPAQRTAIQAMLGN